MSMPAFARRVMELEKKVKVFEAYRYMRIGGVVDVTAPDLPLENCMWADGSLALFDLWPELKAKYENGGFSGLLLPCDCSDEDKTTYPLKWVPDSPNPTGLFVPRLIGLFARYCGGEVDAGKYASDMGRQLLAYADLPVTIDVSWAFAPTGQIEGFVPGGVEVGEKNRYSAFKLDASLVWGAEHSGAEFAPVHYAQPVALYLGRAAQV